ncbi:hypothetical protein BKA67DRAFT_654164 [Truncatella angustata]|uniref:Cytochrome p450 protein n=1 Tax=Truncatella angustata TaxID=152316 RepID=A0A9P8UZL1_9PEZI|nr:uncharacterized protein BKA67DRAFT_654164 [Truncatella angustata]KAH6661020.1 hypothetical protein BKA67DRAFT_654164 [Truncatella angustata]KAH8203729.1 hypothetical protein TruAng_002142 [Truncatella angustata]
MHSTIIALGFLPLLTLAAPQGSDSQAPGPGVPNNVFELYAYGEGFGGVSIFNWNGLAYLGNASLANDTEAAQVLFIRSSESTTTMVGNPLVAPGETAPSWSNVTYFLPSDTTTTHQTGFAGATTSSDEVTTGFVFYGNTAAWEDSTGALQTKWYALPDADTNLWTLNWDSSTEFSSDKVQVTLRTVKPTVPPHNPPGPGNPNTL